MTLRRAAPGPQLSAGRIRVDAAKAIAKLREYQLADRAAWVLEGVRAAVAAKATRITLTADANDVWLAWQGEPWRDELLPRLFDELVSPEAASETHHVRLLAAAVNSALGMTPAYVDVIAIRDGSAARVRYTPEILVEPASELGDSALRHVAVEAIAPPEGRAPGMLVHVRRRLADWRVFTEAPELALARGACRDIAVPVTVDDVLLHRDSRKDVVRVPLGAGIDGYLAVIEPADAAGEAVLEVAERGVVLAEYVLEHELVSAETHLVNDSVRAPLPIRLFVDAPRMPTNASRSQVRRDQYPIADAEKRAVQLMPELVKQLAASCAAGSERAREAALGLIASLVRGGRWHIEAPAIRGTLRELTQLPLVRNAVGQPRALTAHWRPEVHTGGKPFDVELAPWLDSVLWARPDDPVRQLIDPNAVDTRGTRRLARHARRQLRAQKQFFAHEKRELRVLTSATPHVRAPLGVEVADSAVPQAVFDRLQGEVCVYTDGNSAALAVLLDGRLLERVEFDSPLAFDAVIDSPNVEPGDRYRGVKRTASYKRVERAMRGGIARALELHALEVAARPHGEGSAREADAKLFRKGFGVLGELGLPLRGPLVQAPVYVKSDGRWVSLADLANEKVIGCIAPGSSATLPSRRTVLTVTESEQATLATLVPAKIVAYRRTGPNVAWTLPASVAMHTGGALVVREPGLIAVLTPSVRPELRLFHTGVELASRTYLWKWLTCTIAIDCDAFVPDEDWESLDDDAGIAARDFGDWELALVRAIAAAVIGEPPAAFVTTHRVALESRLGVALCEAIMRRDPVELLGEELAGKLRDAPLFRGLGVMYPSSIASIAAQFDGAIPYIDGERRPVHGFAPLVASPVVARAMAKLVGREAIDGTDLLERARRKETRERNLAVHRTRAERPPTIAALYQVPVDGAIARGVVGVHDRGFEIHVLVEGRPFAVFHSNELGLPLVACVEVAASECDDLFEGLPDDTKRTIALDVRAVIPAIIAEIVKQNPNALTELGPARTLLAAPWSVGASLRKRLTATPCFPTIQGQRISIDVAAQPRHVVSVAAWQGDSVGDWFGPLDGEPPDALDAPILRVTSDPQHELSRIIDKLHQGAVVDVTAEVTRLQARRRIARGLVPTPRVAHVPASLKQSLSAFGDRGTRLGVGEIGLVESGTSLVHLYEGGVRTRTESLDVLPEIEIAVELAEPQSIVLPIQQLAAELAKRVLSDVAQTNLPLPIQHNLFRAALARRLDREVAMPLERWREFVDQIEQYGDVWAVREPTELRPLDEQRKVFLLDGATFELAMRNNWNVIDATKELELDNIARINRGRRPATRLELPPMLDGVLAIHELAGDGVSAPRGVIAVLSPESAGARGVWPHIAMHPFDRVDDPCRWPTVAVIDDARLEPDRTWSAPITNHEWQAVTKVIRQASEAALNTIGEVPDDALARVRINSHACAEVGALRKAPKAAIRGVLWLVREPRRDVQVRIGEGTGARTFWPQHSLSIGGKLVIHAPDDLNVDLALEQLCGIAHGKLVRQLMRSDHDADLVAAHVAHALFVRTLRAVDARDVVFPCFVPRSLDARALSALFRREDTVTLVTPSTPPDPDPDAIALVDNGTKLASTMMANLRARLRRRQPPPRARPVHEEPRKPAPPPKQQPVRAEPPPPPHPLMPLVKRLRSRLADLGIGGYRWVIVERAEPMFKFSDEIEVAGSNVRLRALHAALLAENPITEPGIDVVVAHLVTVLNVALSQITDASESHALGVLLANRSSAHQPRRPA